MSAPHGQPVPQLRQRQRSRLSDRALRAANQLAAPLFGTGGQQQPTIFKSLRKNCGTRTDRALCGADWGVCLGVKFGPLR